MLGTLFFMLIFLIFWIAALINWIIAFRVKYRLNKAIKKHEHKLSRNLNVFESAYSTTQMKLGSNSFFKMFISFGSKENTRHFLNNIYDVQAIEETDDVEIKRLLNRLVNLTGNYSRIWIIMMFSIFLAALTWPNK